MYALTLSESHALGLAIKKIVNLLAPGTDILANFLLPQRASEAERVSSFTSISEQLEDLGERKLRNTVIVAATFDTPGTQADDMNPLHAHCNCNLFAWLMLAFPESHWETMNTRTASSFLSRLSETLFLSSVEAPALFDPRGRRAQLYQYLLQEQVETRAGECIVLEDEASHAWLNAYAGYRFGRFNTWTVTRWRLALHLLAHKRDEDIELVIEDVFLRFPDAPLETSLSLIEHRDQNCFHRLKGSRSRPFRLVISGGYGGLRFKRFQRSDGSAVDRAEVESRNRDYVRNRGAWMEKPVAGLFALGQRIAPLRNTPQVNVVVPVVEDGKIKPQPTKPSLGEDHLVDEVDEMESISKSLEQMPDAGMSGHAAPGRLTMIAERLVNRSERLLHRALSVPDAIHAAVLAHDAKELLAGRTPTLAVEALAHQHQAEVVAESMFFGVSTNIRVRERQQEFAAELKRIFPDDGLRGVVGRKLVAWVGRSTHHLTSIWQGSYSGLRERLSKKLMGDYKRRRDAGALINEAVARQFARFGQYDEEQKSLGAARANRFRLGYLRFLMRSPKNLALAVILGWIAFAWVWYWGLQQIGVHLSFVDALIHSIAWSLSGESPEHLNQAVLTLDPTNELWDWWRGLLLAETAWAFFHFAVAVALIVSNLTRR